MTEDLVIKETMSEKRVTFSLAPISKERGFREGVGLI